MQEPIDDGLRADLRKWARDSILLMDLTESIKNRLTTFILSRVQLDVYRDVIVGLLREGIDENGIMARTELLLRKRGKTEAEKLDMKRRTTIINRANNLYCRLREDIFPIQDQAIVDELVRGFRGIALDGEEKEPPPAAAEEPAAYTTAELEDSLEGEVDVSMVEGEGCPVCFEEPDSVLFPCNHHYCVSCIEVFIKNKPVCPTCRGVIEAYYCDTTGILVNIPHIDEEEVEDEEVVEAPRPRNPHRRVAAFAADEEDDATNTARNAEESKTMWAMLIDSEIDPRTVDTFHLEDDGIEYEPSDIRAIAQRMKNIADGCEPWQLRRR